MTTADEVYSIFSDFENRCSNKKFDETDCEALKNAFENVYKEKGLTNADKVPLGMKNILLEEKWASAFSKSIIDCAKEYWHATCTWAPRFDPRFPNQNQTRNCYENYLDYHRCHDKLGANAKECEYFKRVYNNRCPSAWIEKFDDEYERGVLPGYHKDE